MTPSKCFFASSKGDISNPALRINHFRNAGAQDAEEFLSPAPRGNRCAWHSTKVVRDTLSYHPLSHQLNTQWKSCSTTSNTWTSERWLSVSPIFDISTRKTPGHGKKHSILDQFQLWNEGVRQDGRWIPPPPDSGTRCQLIYQFLEGLLPLEKGEGGIYGLNQDFHNQVGSFWAQSYELFFNFLF